MSLPTSFEEVSYFRNEFRGDLVVTRNVFYYFPHTNVAADKHKTLEGGDIVKGIGDIGSLVIPYLGVLPWGFAAANVSYRAVRFGRRTLRPTMNRPKISERSLWHSGEANEELQQRLDAFIKAEKKKPIDIRADESLPKPMRFEADAVKNLKLGLKLKFDTEYDTHDFGFNLLHKKHLRHALSEAGFLQ